MTKQSIQKEGNAFTLPFLIFTVVFCVCLIVANLVEIKTVDVGFTTITAGMVVFPLSYIINDCIVEVYGFRKARMVIWLGFAMNFFVTVMLQLAIILPGAGEWQSQAAMEAIYGGVPRILTASFIAFVCGSMVNALVMSKMKVASNGRYFSLRAILSTVFWRGCRFTDIFPACILGSAPRRCHCRANRGADMPQDTLRDYNPSGHNPCGALHKAHRASRHIRHGYPLFVVVKKSHVTTKKA